MVTLSFPNGTQIVVNLQKPLHEVWMAAKAGGFHYLPAKMHHYAFSKSPTVIQISGEGPFDINYLNPKDDPSGSQK